MMNLVVTACANPTLPAVDQWVDELAEAQARAARNEFAALSQSP
jgi:hypothetical protein